MSDDTSNPPLKRCTKCKQELPRTSEYFPRNKTRKDGLVNICKTCNREYQQALRDNPEYRLKISEKTKNRRKNDPKYAEHCKQIQHNHRKNKPEIYDARNKRTRERRASDPAYREIESKRTKEYRKNHPEMVKRIVQVARIRRSRPGMRERENTKCRERYANDPEYRRRIRVHGSEYGKSERGYEVARAAGHRYRVRQRGGEGTFTAEDVALQYRSQKGKCWHCGKKLNGKFHVDHLIPLSKGGTDWPNNIVCSCAFCNHSKGAKLTQEWNGRLF